MSQQPSVNAVHWHLHWLVHETIHEAHVQSVLPAMYAKGSNCLTDPALEKGKKPTGPYLFNNTDERSQHNPAKFLSFRVYVVVSMDAPCTSLSPTPRASSFIPTPNTLATSQGAAAPLTIHNPWPPTRPPYSQLARHKLRHQPGHRGIQARHVQHQRVRGVCDGEGGD